MLSTRDLITCANRLLAQIHSPSCKWIRKIHSKHKAPIGIDHESLWTRENSNSYILSCPRFLLANWLGVPWFSMFHPLSSRLPSPSPALGSSASDSSCRASPPFCPSTRRGGASVASSGVSGGGYALPFGSQHLEFLLHRGSPGK